MCCENEMHDDAEQTNLTPETQKPQKEHKKVNKKLLIAIAAMLVLAVTAVSVLLLSKQNTASSTDKQTIYVCVSATHYDENGNKIAYYVYEYDEFGNCLSGKYDQELVEVTSEDSNIYYYTYEFDGEFREFYESEYTEDSYTVTQLYEYHEGYTANCQYDKDGRISEFTLSAKPSLEEEDDDSGDPVTYYCEYDKNGRLIRVYRPDEKYGEFTTQLYEYDQDGRLAAASYCSGIRFNYRIEMVYKDGRLSKIERYEYLTDQFQAGEDPEYILSGVAYFRYDEHGNLIEETEEDDEGNITDFNEWVYDKNGHLKEIRSYLEDGSTYITKYTCDEKGNIITVDTYDSFNKCRTVYEYEEREVTAQQALQFDRRAGYISGYVEQLYSGQDYDIVKFLVPNPFQEYRNPEDSRFVHLPSYITP